MLPLLKKCYFQTVYHQFYVAAECYIKYSEIYFICKEAYEISHVDWGRFDWHMKFPNQRKSLRLKVVSYAFLFNPMQTDLH